MLNLSLRVKAVLAAGLLLVTAGGLLAMALVGIFRGVSVDAAESRFGFIAAESRTAVENGINLGFFLDELNRLRGTQDILEQEMARDPAVERIYAFDRAGTVLFSTDVTQVGEPVDPLVRREAEEAMAETARPPDEAELAELAKLAEEGEIGTMDAADLEDGEEDV